MGYPPPQYQYNQALPAPSPAPVPGHPSGMPGVVLAARILLWIQGGLGALVSLLAAAAAVVLALMWDDITDGGPQDFISGLASVGVLMLIIVAVAVVVVLGLLVVGVTVPTLVLAARFAPRRNGIRVGALVLEAIVGVLCLGAGASSAVDGNYAVAAAGLLLAAASSTAFGLLLSPQAAAYFRH